MNVQKNQTLLIALAICMQATSLHGMEVGELNRRIAQINVQNDHDDEEDNDMILDPAGNNDAQAPRAYLPPLE